MSEAERKVAIHPGSRYGRGVRQGYPELIAAGRELRREGERFFDLTGIFSRVPEPLYVDDCCHLSSDGTERLAREIAARIVASLTSESEPCQGADPRAACGSLRL
jgi:lysophospholipase L1-like esterase